MLRHHFHVPASVSGAAIQAVQSGMPRAQAPCWLIGCLNPAAGPPVEATFQRQVRSASSSTSTMDEPDAGASSSGVADTKGRPTDPDWDWAFVVGAKAGRKPAIKRMQRHQWYFCNPNYDPNKPLPSRILPPHAPPSAAHVDEWELFHATVGHKLNAKSRQEFVRFLRLRDVDWRDAFQRGLAEYVAEFKKQKRLEEEKLRQSAWRKYREQVFNNPLRPEWLKPQ